MSKVWFVIDEKKHGDVFSRSLPEGSFRQNAERELELEWGRLTASEKRKSHLYAAYGEADENGDPTWSGFDEVVEIEDIRPSITEEAARRIRDLLGDEDIED